ncbi:MAG: Rpn family recombination-promoting nuclease/putative transposase [Chlorogloeopsis fritschii C42_A2020_084]|uniref:Rpn family recombination-promoting nuclease/putative transposase n=1 Tax=Chlorogloeopsis fritschii TaxID=1124 RepID=UPI0019ECE1AA|nr:Rpn family recombination-promoting nuclease/putative transposase [Chlorogloeopsis fritschii]MBF2009312.1 Rpn family recombination-promoting nuclease/putative transposase [Chlorogloeopsis fritschii C42_A2020_084]
MKTDVIFYELIKELPQIFFELIEKPDTNPNIYTFTAPEVKQQSFRLDGVFSTIEGFENEPLYFVELQTYKDEEFYERLFGEIFVYFRQYKPANSDWYVVVIYDKRIHETLPHPRYRVLMEQHLRCIYLNELSTRAEDTLGIGIAKLFIETPTKATSLAQQLINQARENFPDENIQKKVLAFIQAIIFYKFPNLALEDIEAMLNLDEFKNTRLYESILEKTKLELVPKLIEKNMSIQEIAELLEVDVEIIRKYLQQQS